ncbi:MAG TPA: rod shape-determining protein MreD [Thermoanaerobaculia bacterium]|jgi:rod shape-determining protein MreD
MTAISFALGVALAALVQLVGTALWSGFPAVADPFLVAVVIAALAGRPERALVAGTLAGWTADVLSGGPFGLYGFADAAVAYAAALAAQRIVVDRRATAAALLAAAAVAQGALLVALGFVFRGGGEAVAPLTLLARVGSTAALGLAWLALARGVAARWRRRGRSTGGGAPPRSLLR